MNPTLAGILQGDRIDSTRLVSRIPADEGFFLQEIITELRPKITLEVGLAYGTSALFICEALKKTSGKQHIAMDPYQSKIWKGIGLDNLNKGGYQELVQFHEQFSHIVLPQLEVSGTRIDFAFIDGRHTFDNTLVDFFGVDRLLNVGGVVVLDDTNWKAVRKVCRFITKNRSYSVLKCHTNAGSKILPSYRYQLLKYVARTSRTAKSLIRPEYIESDLELGLVPGVRCIAFRKEAEDTREEKLYHDF